jgi:hypothetical protein
VSILGQKKKKFVCPPRPTQKRGNIGSFFLSFFFSFFIINIKMYQFLCTSCRTKCCISLKKRTYDSFLQPWVHQFRRIMFLAQISSYCLRPPIAKHLFVFINWATNCEYWVAQYHVHLMYFLASNFNKFSLKNNFHRNTKVTNVYIYY